VVIQVLVLDPISLGRILNSDVSDRHAPFVLCVWSIWEGNFNLALFYIERILDKIRDACHVGRVLIVHP
jgi:hypothetical protein